MRVQYTILLWFGWLFVIADVDDDDAAEPMNFSISKKIENYFSSQRLFCFIDVFTIICSFIAFICYFL